MNKKQYLGKYPTEKKDDVPDWICGICSKKISWAAKSITTHLARAHSMSKDQYACQYINKLHSVVDDWGEEPLLCNEEILLDGEPQIQRLDTPQDITDALGIIGAGV